MRSILVCALAVLGCAGCSLDRQGIGATGGRDGSIDRLDAGVIARDGSITEDAGDDAGIVPDGGLVDGGPGDAGIPCGASGQVCCDPDATCDVTLACADGTCVTCGHVTEPCCGDACIDGSTCSDGRCVPPDCGADGQACCAGDLCDPGLACDAPPFEAARCTPCGGVGQPCCAGACNGGAMFYCDILGDCRQCGQRGSRCCAGDQCDEGDCTLGFCPLF